MPLKKTSQSLIKGWSIPLGWCFSPKSTNLFIVKRHLLAIEESNDRIRWEGLK